jgi:hypothetical protein
MENGEWAMESLLCNHSVSVSASVSVSKKFQAAN